MNRRTIMTLTGSLALAAGLVAGVSLAKPIQSDQALKPMTVYASKKGNKLTLEQDSGVQLRLDQFVSSQLNHNGDRIRFMVDKAIVARGYVVIPRGARAYGVVTEVQPAKGWGRGGKLVLDFTHVEAYDGTKVPLMTTMRDSRGQDFAKTGAYAAGLMMAPVTLLVAPVGGGVKGKKIELAEGTIFNAFVKEDVSWKLTRKAGKMSLPGVKGTPKLGEGDFVNDSAQGECMTDICAEYSGTMFRTCMAKCQGD